METGDVSYITRLGNARRLIQTLDKVCVEQYIQDHLPEITGDTQTSTIINEYLNDILSPRLYEYGVSTDFQRRISSVISEQMTSALFHWKEMKEVFYTLTAEEALFYKPEAPDDVKVFVVLTVRNSPIETLQSDYFRQAGLKQKISDEQLKIITSEAIMFFKDIQLCNCDEVKPESDEDDLYGYLRDSYCIAWRTLEQISKCETQSTTFSSFAYQHFS